MTKEQVRALYPHNVVARMAASAYGDDRKGERRAASMDHNAKLSTVLPEQRTKFEQAVIKKYETFYSGAGGYSMVYLVKGAFNDAGEWVYQYDHINRMWEGYCMALKEHGVVLA